MTKKMPWQAPDMASLSSTEEAKERQKYLALRDAIEGGCWFSHVGAIGDMERSYAKRSGRGQNPDPNTTTSSTSKLEL